MDDKQTKVKPAPAQKNGRFVKGNCGGGRPKGSTDKRTALYRKAIDEALPDVLEKVIEMAKQGDLSACKILVDRSLPAIRPIELARAVPVVGDTLTQKAESIVDNVASGYSSIEEATRLLQALGSVARIIETDELVRRIEALEVRSHGN